MNDVELKTHVSEEMSEQFIVLTALMGFKSRSEYLRFIIEREVRGVLPQVQNTAPNYARAGQNFDQNGAK
jgi:hypothetical protein